jgi:8-oxo-dGTP pyrophosphatase MutT (NUDIX family)
VPIDRPNRHQPDQTRVQFGALPYRFDGGVSVEVLLVTSREIGRWITPKGRPIKGFKPAETAAREAFEEAGVRGLVSGRPLGRYVYEKWMEDRVASFPATFKVFLAGEDTAEEVAGIPATKGSVVFGPRGYFRHRRRRLRKLILRLKEHGRAVRRKYKGARQR